MKKSYALVTGASSGIGLEISNELAKQGFNLIITARREDKLRNEAEKIQRKYNVAVDFISSDLSDIDAPNKIFNFCEQKNYQVDILVNNAGYGIKTSFHETPMEDEEKFIRVLGTSVIALSKAFLPKMMERNFGKIMIVSSVAAFAPPSSIQALYGPIKTFMNRFSDSLNINYNDHGITSTAVCPGFTHTEFHTASGVQDEMDRVPSFMKKTAYSVAEEAVIATLKGKKVCIPSKTFKLIVFLLKIVPHSLFPFFSKRLAPGRYDKK